MNSLEDRLRDAYRSATDTVRPETVRSLPDLSTGRSGTARRAGGSGTARRAGMTRPSGRPSRSGMTGRAGRERRLARSARPTYSRGHRIGVPLAAAAAVLAIAVTASVLATNGPGGTRGSSASQGGGRPAGGLAQGYPGGRLPAAKPPKFFVAIQSSTSGVDYATTLAVFSSATGRRVGQLPSPVANRYFQAVATMGSDQTFVVAASPGQRAGKWRTCGTWLYQFRLTRRGQPTALKLLMPEVAGFAQPRGLAASADGNVVAYDAESCTETRRRIVTDLGQIGVLHIGSGTVTRWTYTSPAPPVSLSLSADGGVLGMVSNPSDGSQFGSDGFNSAWVLRTGSAPGQLGQRYRKVASSPDGVEAATISPTGAVTYVASTARLGRSERLTLAGYQTSTGRLIRSMRVFPRLSELDAAGLSPDLSGRYVLLYLWTQRDELVDLATGRNVFVPRTVKTQPLGIAW
jgi:hypothetical protein